MFHAPSSETKRNDPLRGHETTGPESRTHLHGAARPASLAAAPSLRGSQQLARLHSTYGNQAVLRVLSQSSPAFQTKLKVNEPGDLFEQEADRVADQVMRMAAPAPVQRKCGSCEEEDKVQRKCAECEDEEKKTGLQRKGSTAEPQFAPSSVHSVLNSPGQSLDPVTRAFMEPRFGHDFSSVQIHTDTNAADSARAVNALAYTSGQHVVFGAGQYSPSTSAGRRLLAHELAHTVQQTRLPHAGSRLSRAAFDQQEPTVTSPSSSEGQPAGSPPQPTPEIPGQTGSPAPLESPTGATAPQPEASASPAATPASSATGSACPSRSPTFVAGPQLLFEHDSTTLTAASAADVRCLVEDAKCATHIELHGNASNEGDSAHNQDLSCRRAQFVASLLSGVSASIDLFAHGATTAYSPAALEPNRNVVLVMTIPGSPPPLPFCKVVPGVSTPTTIGTFAPPGGCGAGDDFLSFPARGTPGGLINSALIAAAESLPEAVLIGTFTAELVTAAGAGPAGSAAITQFLAGSGATVVHRVGSILITEMLASPVFLTAQSAVQADIVRQVKAQAGAGAIDWRLISVTPPPIHFPRTTSGFGSGPLASVIGGTQGDVISIINFKVTPCTRTFTATLRFDICDDFGVDQPDVVSPGLAAFWVLQHARPGHAPFINELIADVPISGSF